MAQNWRAFQGGINTLGSQLAERQQAEQERKQKMQDMFMKALLPELIKKQFPEAKEPKEPSKYGIEALRFEKAKSKFKSQAEALKPKKEKKLSQKEQYVLYNIQQLKKKNATPEDIMAYILEEKLSPAVFQDELQGYRPFTPPPQPSFMNRMAGGASNMLRQFNPFQK